jgi:hypothetical protein
MASPSSSTLTRIKRRDVAINLRALHNAARHGVLAEFWICL